MSMKVLFVDGSGIASRTFEALYRHIQENPNASDSVRRKQILDSFFTQVLWVADRIKPTHLFIAFDAGGHGWRKELYPDYKAKRGVNDTEEKRQMKALLVTSYMHQLTRLGYTLLLPDHHGVEDVRCITANVGEADDLALGLIKALPDADHYLFTYDSDYYQLIAPNVRVVNTVRKEDPHTGFRHKYYVNVVYDDAVGSTADITTTVWDLVGVESESYIEYKAIAGDSSDNIPGVYGVGKDTARTIINTYGSLRGFYEEVDSDSAKVKETLKQSGVKRHNYTVKNMLEHKVDCRTAYRLIRMVSEPLDIMTEGGVMSTFVYNRKEFELCYMPEIL